MWQLRCKCNSRPPDGAPVLIRFNHDAHAKFEVTQPIRCRLVAFFTVNTLSYIVTLTSDPV